jgi:hypothetical protein
LPFFVGDESVTTFLETQRPSPFLGGKGGPSLGAERHPLLMVGTCPLEVDQLLRAGEFRCPDCTGELRPWGHARERGVRGETAVVTLRPRRSACSQCSCTHVLLPSFTLLRRADTVEVIGQALLAKAAGAGHRRIAALLDRPVSTVRGWLRRFGVRADSLRVLFTVLLHELDACAPAAGVTGSVFTDALEALGLAAAAAARLFGPRPVWQFASAASGGRLLGPSSLPRTVANTS